MTKNNTPAIAAAPVVIEGTEFIKPSGFNSGKDWSYLLDKDPSSNHALFAAIMRQELGKEAVETASLEQLIYWFLAMHRWMQASDANQAREGFRGRKLSEVIQGSETLLERAASRAVVEGEDAPLVTSRTHVEIDEKFAPREEVQVKVTDEEAQDQVKVTKADLIDQVKEVGTELSDSQLKKLTVKKLEAILA